MVDREPVITITCLAAACLLPVLHCPHLEIFLILRAVREPVLFDVFRFFTEMGRIRSHMLARFGDVIAEGFKKVRPDNICPGVGGIVPGING